MSLIKTKTQREKIEREIMWHQTPKLKVNQLKTLIIKNYIDQSDGDQNGQQNEVNKKIQQMTTDELLQYIEQPDA